ncbi:hypothetical protein Pfo_007414 [Paulownia fortunei]|nr:hypothetical protein Pfo_007414 [Paulownia fortunei]
MADSTSTQDSCVCVFAIPGPPMTRKQNQDQFIVEVSVSIGAVSHGPVNPVRKISPKIHRASRKTFQRPRQAFLAATQAEQRDIISKMIQSVELPFPLENIHWGLDFPADQTASKFENLDEIIAGPLSDIAGSCAKNDQKGYMDIRIRKLEKLPPEDYRKLCEDGVNNRRQPLDDWIQENQNDANLHRPCCLGVIQKLALESPMDNKYFGLKSVKMKEDLGDEAEEETSSSCCSICMQGLKKGSQAIRMPCSHIFHGFCVFRWIAMNPTCPLCRFQLFSSITWSVD